LQKKKKTPPRIPCEENFRPPLVSAGHYFLSPKKPLAAGSEVFAPLKFCLKMIGKNGMFYMGVSLNGGTPKTPQNDSF